MKQLLEALILDASSHHHSLLPSIHEFPGKARDVEGKSRRRVAKVQQAIDDVVRTYDRDMAELSAKVKVVRAQYDQSEAELSSRLSNLRGGDPALLNYAKAVPQPLRDELVGLDKGAVVPPEWQKEAVASLSKQLGLLGAEVEKTVREALAKEIALLFRLCGLLTVLSLIATFFIGGGPLPQDEPQPEHGPSDLPEEAS